MYALAVAAGVLAGRRGRSAGAECITCDAPPGASQTSSTADDGGAPPERRTRRRTNRRLAVAGALCALTLGLGVAAPSGASSGTADEVHYTYTGSTSVT